MEYYVLMHGDKFIDVDKLNDGIFVTQKPTLMSTEFNEEELLDEWTEKIIMDGYNKMQIYRFIENWNKIKVVKIELNIL